MSGILAMVSLDGRPVAEDLARAQLSAIAHRGEQEPRLWLGSGAALGHVHLPRTPEAEREAPPMADRTGRYHLTWDGRLDNRDELAATLGLEAPRARRMTDAEYVLAAYARWGDACVHRLLGDWAIVLWDSWERRLFCAKDPLGWRDLYFARHHGLLLIGSEPQQLMVDGGVPMAVNEEFVHRFIADAVQEPGETCHAGIHVLDGGQTLVADREGVHVRTYWAHPSPRESRLRTVEDAADAFASVFREAVRARLRTSHTIGVFLSGGLDSSYVAAVATELGSPPVALTAYHLDVPDMDERQWSRRVTGHLGLRSVEFDIAECWALSRRWLTDAMFDGPDHPGQSAFFLRKAGVARTAGIGVTLGGEGGDEWCLGGEGFVADAVLQGRWSTAWQLARCSAGGGSAWGRLARDCWNHLAPIPVQDAAALVFRKERYLGFPAVVEPRRGWISYTAYQRATAWQHTRSVDAIWRWYRVAVMGAVAWRERHAFAPNGIEHRTPYNDLRVVELMASLPDWMKWHGGRTKAVLRASARTSLPAAIADRTDKGAFTELLPLGIAVHEQERLRQAIDAVSQLPGIRGHAASEEAERWIAHRHRWWHVTWRLIGAGMWLHELDRPRGGAAARNACLSITSSREEVTA